MTKRMFECPKNDSHRWALEDDGQVKLCPKCKAETGENVELIVANPDIRIG